ncbi:maleylpyruvate isomerase N-terminal domain-containing protein [Actinomadura fulvescens]|uniref:Mycothiol-dependent maleylpyruvate isomerase metal-binding domain-containing protein n=1 Tax=Actinomadura fulvescens TaxID=46160 RepID=A0ABN3PUK8_9ACTN
MTQVRADYLAVAESVAALVNDPVVAGAWDEPSALPRLTVGALANHLAGQISFVALVLPEPPAEQPVIEILDYYARVGWIGTGLDEPFNLRIQRGEAKAAADGPQALISRTAKDLGELRDRLPAEPPRAVHLPVWGDWSLSLDDFVTSRLMELVVHTDDLAVSVGLPTPPLPSGAVDTVVVLLARLAVQRHGPVDVVRALSRAERAPTTIAAI